MSVLRSCNFSPSVQVLSEQFNISNEAQSGLPFLGLVNFSWVGRMGMNFKVMELCWRDFTHYLQETLQIFDALDSNHDEDIASTCFKQFAHQSCSWILPESVPFPPMSRKFTTLISWPLWCFSEFWFLHVLFYGFLIVCCPYSDATHSSC